MSVTNTAAPAAPAEETKKGGLVKKLLILVVLLAVVGGGVYWFVLRPEPKPAPPEPGEVLSMEPIQVNLAGGHYLRVGIALQMTAEVADKPDGSKALDRVIETFSGKSMEDVIHPEHREELKEHLLKELEHDYHGEVMDVYFTDFVTQ